MALPRGDSAKGAPPFARFEGEISARVGIDRELVIVRGNVSRPCVLWFGYRNMFIEELLNIVKLCFHFHCRFEIIDVDRVTNQVPSVFPKLWD